jgi:hypothetical protein
VATPCVGSTHPTPEANITQHERPNVWKLEAMHSQVISYSFKKDSSSPLEFEGISWNQFVMFRENAKKEIPGWDKLKYIMSIIPSQGADSVDYFTNLKKCIIQCTGPGHEIMGNVFM